MVKQVLNKIVAILIVLAMTSGNLILIGTESYAAYEELESQKIVSSEENVSFDAYFYVDGKNVHSVTLNSSDEAIVNFEINVKEGYLKDLTIELSNANYKIESIESQNVENIVNAVEENKIQLNQISSNTDVIISAKIKNNHTEIVDADYLGRETTANFRSKYINIKGKEDEVKSSIITRINWVADATSNIDITSEKYMKLNNKTIIQAKVTSGINGNVLPIKNTNIKLQAPSIGEKLPEEVRVRANTTIATNGIENGNSFAERNWKYNKENGEIQINVENPINSENKISWKNGSDEYIITYIYDTVEEISNINLKAENTLITYIGTEVKNAVEKTQEIKLSGNNVDFNAITTENVSKGYIYANSQYETEYKTTWMANISYIDAIDGITLTQETDKYVQDNGAKLESDSVYKNTKINKENFDKILGADGIVQIYNNDNLIGTIDKNTQPDENGDLIYTYNEEVKNIKITTSKPVTEGKIIIENSKAIRAVSSYDFGTQRTFIKIETSLIGTCANQEVQSLIANTNLQETQTKTQLQIGKENLSTVVTNEDVEIRAILEADDITDDLYKNPTIEINMPEEVQNIKIKSANILFNNEMQITSIEIVNNRIIKLGLTGEQTSFITDGNKGITVILNTDLSLIKTAASRDTQATLKVTNEKAIQLQNEGVSATPVSIVAPTGIIALNGVTNTKTGETVTSLESNKKEAQLERNTEKQVASYTNTIINNNNNTISNVKILGNIPSQGDSYGSTINAKLISNINSVEGINYVAYYSENINATSNLEDTNNGWTRNLLENAKAYLIVLNENIEQGRELNFTYNLELPENLEYGSKAISTYKVEYTEGANTEGKIASVNNTQFMKYAVAETNTALSTQTETAAVVSLTTGEGPVLEAILKNDVINNNTYVNQDVTYSLKIKNIGTGISNSTKAIINIPENMEVEKYIIIDNEKTEVKDDKLVIDFGKIDINEEKIENFILTYKTSSNIDIYAQVLAEGLDNEVNSNKVSDKINENSSGISFSITDNTYPKLEEYKVNDIVRVKVKVVNNNENEVKDTKVSIKLPGNVSFVNFYEEESTEYKYEIINNNLVITFNEIKGNGTDIRVYFDIKINSLGSNPAQNYLYLNNQIVGSQYFYINTEEYKYNLNIESSMSEGYVKRNDIVKYNILLENNDSIDFKDFYITIEFAKDTSYINSIQNGNIIDGKNNDTEEDIENENYLFDGENNILKIKCDILKGETLNLQISTVINVNEKYSEDTEIITKIKIDNINAKKEFKYTIEKNSNIESDNPANPDTPDNKKTYKISGTAWLDSNKNGKMEDEETKMSGISVKAIDKTGNVISSATTKKDGIYTLENLSTGEYTVIFDYDTNKYILTTYQKEGIEENVNSDVVKGKYNNKDIATTNIIKISDRSIANINIGLIEGTNFDLSLNKKVTQIAMTNTKTSKTKEYNTQLAKIDLDYKYINNTQVAVEYEITISNEGDIPGYATKIVDYLPKEFDFSSELNKDWYTSGNKIETKALANTIINPGESKTVTLILTKNMTEKDNGIVCNTAEIEETYNEFGQDDIDSIPGNNKEGEDDISSANVILGLKTGGPVTYITLTITIMVLICIGAYEVNKKVLKI